jgi:drug/metabolite transporter (DMT)-like permease
MFNVTKNLAVNIAPNIGYVNAANAGSIAALTVVSAIVFKDKLTLRKMIGVVGIFIGLVLIFI